MDTYLPLVYKLPSDTVLNPFITGYAIFFLQAFFLEFGGTRLDFGIKDLNKLRLCIRGRIIDVMVA